MPIRENDVRNAQEIALDIFTSEIVPNPVVSGSQLVFLLAVQSEGVVVEGLCEEHGIGTIGARHGHLIAR